MFTFQLLLLIITTTAVYCNNYPEFTCQNVDIVKRKQWESTVPRPSPDMIVKPNRIFVHHSGTDECNTVSACLKTVREQQLLHKDVLGENDIDVQFLIGGDGRVYEGLGWYKKGPHTQGYPDDFGVTFIGKFNESKAPDVMINAFLRLIVCGVQFGALPSSPSRPSIYAHSDARCSTSCPGAFLREQLKSIPGYQSPKINCKAPQPFTP